MGYTHYARIKEGEVEQELWNKIVKDCKKLYKNMPKHSYSSGGYYKDAPLKLSGCYRYEKPKFTKNMILFNGSNGLKRISDIVEITSGKDKGKSYIEWNDAEHKNSAYNDLGHETFSIRRKNKTTRKENKEDNYVFTFCKTGRKPYDLMVQACMLVAKFYLEDDYILSSDGNRKDWKEAILFVSDILGIEYVANEIFNSSLD